MKPATFFLALTLITLFTTPSLSSWSIVDDTLVLDVEGNPLEKYATYFIGPPIWGPLGGKLILTSPNGQNETCEADVVQYPFNLGPSTPFTFTPVNLEENVIKLGYPLAIQSPTENPCDASTVWKVTSRVGIHANIITTGGIFNTPSSCLGIIKPYQPLFPNLNTYIFEYCPNSCGAGVKMCLPLGIYKSDNQRHLSPNADSPFEFSLLKVSSSAAKI